jgi:hypothetical protein
MDALVQINGTLVGPIAIHSGIRQGCPLSMFLYAMCLHPLVRSLEESLPGIKIGRRHLKTTVIAQADDVSLFVTDPASFTTIRHAISTYEQANGARLNPLKSNATGYSRMGRPKNPTGHPLQWPYWHLRGHLWPHHRTLQSRQLVANHPRGTCPGKEIVRKNTMLGTKDRICHDVSLGKNLVHCANSIADADTCPTAHFHLQVIHMTDINLQSAHHDTSALQTWGWVEFA